MSEGQEQENQGGFTVKDKRRFDSEGNERANDSIQQEPTKSQLHQEMPSSKPTSNAWGPSGIDFSSFVMSLASQALWQLGVMPPPEGVEVPIDADAARQTIEILGMLESKTEGNLDEGEIRLLGDILHELRMSYVKITRG
jgi:hypothetical protein